LLINPGKPCANKTNKKLREQGMVEIIFETVFPSAVPGIFRKIDEYRGNFELEKECS
jgi:hypothetical protein